MKGEVVCSQKDFRINLFIPGEDDLILLTPWSAAASSFLLDQHPVVEVQHPVVEDQHQQSGFRTSSSPGCLWFWMFPGCDPL